MPITNVTRDDNGKYANYPIASELKSDDERYPFINPADSGVMYLPGEPILREMNGDQYVFLTQKVVKPGHQASLVKRFLASFPFNGSANVVEGTPIYWDTDANADDNPDWAAGVARVEGDVTNGFQIGVAAWVHDENNPPSLNGDDKVICATSSSTRIYVLSIDGPSPGLGTHEYGAS